MPVKILEDAFETFTKVQLREGSPAPDEVSFVGGFITCFGIICGNVDIGLDRDAPLDKILDQIHKEIATFGKRVATNQARQMQ